MVSNDSTEEILAAWRNGIDASQEAGAVPSLHLGESNSLLDGLPGLLVCRKLASERTDLSSPWVLAGGGSALWTVLALHGTPPASAPHAERLVTMVQPSMMPLYAGADAATVMATETLRATAQTLGHAGFPRTVPDDLPGGMVSRLEPSATPGSIVPWEALPFAVMEPASDGAAFVGIDWTAFAAIFLAICLILLALIV